MIKYEIAEKVIDIMSHENESERGILCDLNGLTIEFVERYYPIAEMEMKIYEGVYDVEYVEITSRDYVVIHIFDNDIHEMNNWNNSFSSNIDQLDEHRVVHVPTTMISKRLRKIITSSTVRK